MYSLVESRNTFRQSLRLAQEALAELPRESEPKPKAKSVELRDLWPTLDERAIRGVIGDLVRAIEPHSEADVVALLIQGLIAFGSTLNRSAYFAADADRHHMNLNAVLVGETAKGRKGTSWGYVRRVFHGWLHVPISRRFRIVKARLHLFLNGLFVPRAQLPIISLCKLGLGHMSCAPSKSQHEHEQ